MSERYKYFFIPLLCFILINMETYSQNYNLTECNKFNSNFNFIQSYQNEEVNDIKPVLWLDANNTISEDNYHVSQWIDKSEWQHKAYQDIFQRRPNLGYSEINGLPAVWFSKSTAPGTQDGLIIDASPLITPFKGDEDKTPKTFSIVFNNFRTDTRQVIFEAGSARSGYIVYIEPGTVSSWIYFGMYSNFDRRFLKLPITPGLHIAQLEFDGYGFRGILDGKSTSKERFAGLSGSESESGIGTVANGTRFHDISCSGSYVYHFEGLIPEIILYNYCDIYGISKIAFESLVKKYNISAEYPVQIPRTIETDLSDLSLNFQTLYVFPNPIIDKAIITFESQIEELITCDLYSLDGEYIHRICEKQVSAGLSYDFDFYSNNLSSGKYFIKLIGNNTSRLIEITLIK